MATRKLTPEQKERKREYARKYVLSAEQKERKRAYARAQREKLTPEDRRRENKRQLERLARRTPEQKERLKAYKREYMRQRALNATPEEKAAKIEKMRRWYYSAQHDEMLAALRDKRRDAPGREKRLEAMRRWNAANKEYRSEYMRRYHLANPERTLANNRTRKARRRAAPGKHTADDIRALFESQRGACAACAVELVAKGRGKYHVDHVVPVKLGGSNGPENLQLLCPPCNLSKRDKHPNDWSPS